MSDETTLYPEGVEVQGARVFMRLGNYEFEVVVAPTMRRAAGHLEAAASLARLLSEKLAESGAGELKHQRDLLADALGRVLVATGVASDVPMTGPQLLLLAEDYIAHKEGRS